MAHSLPTPLLAQLQAAAWRLAERWIARRRRGADRRLLADMGTRELHDIGLGRDQIGYITGPSTPGRCAD